jgi:hypothetical protein
MLWLFVVWCWLAHTEAFTVLMYTDASAVLPFAAVNATVVASWVRSAGTSSSLSITSVTLSSACALSTSDALSVTTVLQPSQPAMLVNQTAIVFLSACPLGATLGAVTVSSGVPIIHLPHPSTSASLSHIATAGNSVRADNVFSLAENSLVSVLTVAQSFFSDQGWQRLGAMRVSTNPWGWFSWMLLFFVVMLVGVVSSLNS